MLIRIIYIILSLVLILQLSSCKTREYIYVGTFSGDVEKGIYVYEFDRYAGTLSLIQTLGGMTNPTYLEIHPNGKFLYSVNRNTVNEEEEWGSVSAYSIDQASGKLIHINDQSSQGNAPCHMSIDSQGRLVFIANYGSGSVAAYPILEDGSIEPASKFVQHTGSSVRGERQQGPHAHCSVVSPNDDYLYAADLGIDRVKTYRIDYKENTFNSIPASDGIIHPGGGPRHIAISANQKFAYVLEEMDAHVSVFAIDPENGALSEVQRIPTLPDDYSGTNYCADIHIDPSGKHLYATNRGHNSLAIYEINDESGMLSLLDQQSVHGDWPRNFLIDPKGDFVFVANRKTNNVVVFRRDPSSGKLTNTGVEISVPEPVCTKMLEIK
ncbi:lactonase family protein [Bacteroidota bacterium]